MNVITNPILSFIKWLSPLSINPSVCPSIVSLLLSLFLHIITVHRFLFLEFPSSSLPFFIDLFLALPFLVSHCYPLIAFLSFQCHILFSPCFLPHYFLLFTSISSNFILSFCCTILLHWCFYCLEENRFPFPLLNMHAPNSCRRHIRVPYPSLF